MPHMFLRTAIVAGATTLAGAVTLSAAPLAATAATGPPKTGSITVTGLRGYRTVTSVAVPSPSQTQRRGTANCPTGTVPLGGGVTVLSSDRLVSVNSSFPIAGGWNADVNNASGTDTTFFVSVTCAAKPAHYVMVTTRAKTNPAATQTGASATCPVGTSPLGGGALSGSGGLFVTLSSSAPVGTRSWRITENNATGEDARLAAAVLCGSVKGYVVSAGPVRTVAGPSVTALGASCPTGRMPTGGGAVIQSSSIAAYLNSTSFGD